MIARVRGWSGMPMLMRGFTILPPVFHHGQQLHEIFDLGKSGGLELGIAVEQHAANTGSASAHGVFLDAVPDVERFAGLGFLALERMAKNLGSGLGVSDVARNQNRLEFRRDAESFENA